MNERRRFLQVVGGSVIAGGCGGTVATGSGGGAGTGGATGGGGAGGEATTSSSSTSSSSSTTSTTTSSSSSSGTTCSPTGVNAGMPSAYTTDGLHKVPGTTVLIGRDAGGLFARSSLCTHQSCNLNSQGKLLSGGGMHCNCHGAEYDALGDVTKGPAPAPLKSFKLTLECDGNLWVDKTTVVPADQRLMA